MPNDNNGQFGSGLLNSFADAGSSFVNGAGSLFGVGTAQAAGAQPPQPSGRQQPQQSQSGGFGDFLSTEFFGPRYTAPDPQMSPLDQAAYTLTERLNQANKVATNPWYQFFDSDQTKAARDFVPKAVEQLQNIEKQKADIQSHRVIAQNLGILPGEFSDQSTTDNLIALAVAKARNGNIEAFNGLSSQIAGPEANKAAESVADQHHAAVGANLDKAQATFDSLSNTKGQLEYTAALNDPKNKAGLAALESFGMKPPNSRDMFGAQQGRQALQLRDARIGVDTMGQKLEQRNIMYPMAKPEADLYTDPKNPAWKTARGDAIGGQPSHQGGPNGPRHLVIDQYDNPQMLGKGQVIGSTDQYNSINAQAKERVGPEEMGKYRNFNRMNAFATTDKDGNKLPDGKINSNSLAQTAIIEGLTSMFRGLTGSANVGLVNIAENLKPWLQGFLDKIQTEKAGAINNLKGSDVVPYLTNLSELQKRTVLDFLQKWNDKNIGDRLTNLGERAGALGFDSSALGLAKGEGGGVDDAVERGRQAEIALDMQRHKAIGSGRGALEYGATVPQPQPVSLPEGYTPQQTLQGPAPSNSPGPTPSVSNHAFSVVSQGETGDPAVGVKSIGNISSDTDGSYSYGTLGLNSGTGSVQSFVRNYGQQFGLTAPAGSPVFNAQWRAAASGQSDAFRSAQQQYFNERVMPGISKDLQGYGVPASVAADPRVQTYFADRAVQMSTIGLHVARDAWANSGGNPAQFLRNMNQIDGSPQQLQANFHSAIASGVYNERGHATRLRTRLAGAFAAGMPEEAPVGTPGPRPSAPPPGATAPLEGSRVGAAPVAPSWPTVPPPLLGGPGARVGMAPVAPLEGASAQPGGPAARSAAKASPPATQTPLSMGGAMIPAQSAVPVPPVSSQGPSPADNPWTRQRNRSGGPGPLFATPGAGADLMKKYGPEVGTGLGTVIGTGLGGPGFGTAAGAGIGGSTGQMIKSWLRGEPQSPIDIIHQGAFGTATAVAPELRLAGPLAPLVGIGTRTAGVAAVEGGAKLAEGGDMGDAATAAIESGEGALAGNILGHGISVSAQAVGRFVSNLGRKAYNLVSKFTQTEQQKLMDQGLKLTDAEKVLEEQEPKLPANAQGMAVDNPKHVQAKADAHAARTQLKDNGHDPDDIAHAADLARQEATRGEAALSRPLAAEQTRLGAEYEAKQEELRTALGAPENAIVSGTPKVPRADSYPENKIYYVDPAKVDAAWSRDKNFYVGPEGSGDAASQAKYNAAKDYLQKADSFDAPELGVQTNGRVGFDDGRHRFAALRDMGAGKPIPVAMSPQSARNAAKAGYLSSDGAIPDGPMSKINTADNPGGTILPTYQPEAAAAQRYAEQPAANPTERWINVEKAQSLLLRQERNAYKANDLDRAEAMRAMATSLRGEQQRIAEAVLPPGRSGPFMNELHEIDKQYATVMQLSDGIKPQKLNTLLATNTPESREFEINFRRIAKGDPSAIAALNATKVNARRSSGLEGKLTGMLAAGELATHAGAFAAGMPEATSLPAMAAGGVSAIVAANRFYKYADSYLHARVLGQRVKFSDFFRNESAEKATNALAGSAGAQIGVPISQNLQQQPSTAGPQ